MTKVKPISTTVFYEQLFNGIPEIYSLSVTLKENKAKMENFYKLHVIPVSKRLKEEGEIAMSFVKRHTDNLIPLLPRVDSVLQASWVMSHLFTIIGTIASICYSMRFKIYGADHELFWYNLAIYSSITTYILITYRHIEVLVSTKMQNDNDTVEDEISVDSIPLSAILKSENTHLLGVSLLAAASEQSVFKLIAAGIYSFMNLSNYIIMDMFPNYTLSNVMIPLLNYFEGSFLITAATIDYLVIFIYFREFLSQSNTQYFVMYSLICLMRIESSESCRLAIKKFFNLVRFFLAEGDSQNSMLTICNQLEIFCLSTDRSLILIEDKSDQKVNLRKQKDRVTSLVLNPFTVINDLDS